MESDRVSNQEDNANLDSEATPISREVEVRDTTSSQGADTARRGTPAEALPEAGVFPVLPVPPPSEQCPQNTATVFPQTVRVLDFRASEREAARLVLQYLQLRSSAFVVLMEEHNIPAPPVPSSSDPTVVAPLEVDGEASTTARANTIPPHRHAVLAEVIEYEVCEATGEDTAMVLHPMRPEADRERWVKFGLPTGPTSQPLSREELDQLEQLSIRVRAVRILVQGLCRIKYHPGEDFRYHPQTGTTSDASGTTSEALLPTADLPHHPSLVLLQAQPISNTLGAANLEDEVAKLQDMARQAGDDATVERIGDPANGSRLDHLTEIATTYFNDLVLSSSYWNDRLQPFRQFDGGNPGQAATRLDRMADELYRRAGDGVRQRWLETDDIGTRITMVFETIHTLDQPPAERQEQIAQESAEALAVKQQRREQCWSAKWRERAAEEDPFDQPPNEDRRKFDRQRYYRELPQASDRREMPPLTRATMRTVLDRELHGLDEAKSMIIERLLEQQLARSKAVRPLCLVGPPGVGKTSLAKAVAIATGRRFVEVHLPDAAGGIDLKGSEPNWRGSTVGRIIKAMHEAGECNPVMLLDEIDKLNVGGEKSGAGDPTPVVMEILDPDKNSKFVDALLELPYDLSQVFFIATANVDGNIAEPLQDRMTTIRLPGYSEEEKMKIARDHLIPHIEQMFHLAPGEVDLPDDTLLFTIRDFCPGKGVRNLTDQLKRLYVLTLERRHGHPNRTTEPPNTITVDDAGRMLSKKGKQAFWSDQWVQKLRRLKKEEEEKRRYLQELPQPCDMDLPIKVDLAEASAIMNQSHFGLDEVKEQILDYLSVEIRKGGDYDGQRGDKPICLIGPPGVGKTTLCRSIARATHRVFQRISVGGANLEYQLRGYPEKPGRVLEAMLAAGRFNPLILLDEIDKIDQAPGGKQAALLEILDPEQNTEFVDHFIGLPYNLAGVLFIASANYENNIPRELVDRLDIIRIRDYSLDEKRIIVNRYLIPRVLEHIHLTAEQLSFSEAAVEAILHKCTGNTGVRGLEEYLIKVARRPARTLPKGGGGPAVEIEPHHVEEVIQMESSNIGFDIEPKSGDSSARPKESGSE